MLGRPGLKLHGGRMEAEYKLQLRGRSGQRIYAEMQNDGIVSGSMLVWLATISGVGWPVEAASDAPEDRYNAEFLESCRDDMSIGWDSFVAQLASFVPLGYSLAAIEYKLRKGRDQSDGGLRSHWDDGMWGWRTMLAIPQETVDKWLTDPADQSFVGVEQLVDAQRYTIPVERLLLFRALGQASPEGRPMLRGICDAWGDKRKIRRLRSIRIARDATGMPRMGVPSEIIADSKHQAVKDEYLRQLDAMAAGEQLSMLWPLAYDDQGHELYRPDLQTSPGAPQVDTIADVENLNREMAIGLGTGVILIGHEPSGSRAVADNKTDTLGLLISSALKAARAVINDHAVPRLFALNPTLDTRNGFPRFADTDIETLDPQKIGALVSQLEMAGFNMRHPEIQAWVLKAVGLPVPADLEAGAFAEEQAPEGGQGVEQPVEQMAEAPDRGAGK